MGIFGRYVGGLADVNPTGIERAPLVTAGTNARPVARPSRCRYGPAMPRAALALLVAAVLGSMLLATAVRASDGACVDSPGVRIFVSPRAPQPGQRLRVLVTSDGAQSAPVIVATSPDGRSQTVTPRRYGVGPFGFVAETTTATAGPWRMELASATTQAPRAIACRTVHVGVRLPSVKRALWARDTENLYSLWIEHLFAAPEDVDVSWRPLHDVLRDDKRNLLFGHLGLDEDARLVLRPDCADLSYELRAYFAWKLGLPFGYRTCTRGNASRSPTCGELNGIRLPNHRRSAIREFETYVRGEVAREAHSGSGRTALETDHSDYYPVALTQASLRPGTIYADPYGHVLMLSQWVPPSADRPGILFAVDAQPDQTVGRRRFWAGSFLFPEDGAVAGAGFKRFRPIRAMGPNRFRALSNRELATHADYGDFSLDQGKLGKQGFYDTMDALINPGVRPPERALVALMDALTAEVQRRVSAVDNGEEWKRKNPRATATMPVGAAIFQTAGPWEDYASPSRDLRLLIALTVVLDFPNRVRRQPQRFQLAPGTSPEAAASAIEALIAANAARRTFAYTRSDGSAQTLTVADVIARQKALEVAYNPNDCPEVRWGAPAGSAELATCKRRAPRDQQVKMAAYRAWFARRQRPTR